MPEVREKPDPTLAHGDEFAPSRQWVNQLWAGIVRDNNSRQAWLIRQADYLRRRFSVELQDVKFPWPGASTLVIPTIDKAVKRLSSAYIQSTLGPDPPVVVIGQNAASHRKAVNVERRLKHLIDVRMPEVERELSIAVDSFLQTGSAFISVGYDFRTRDSREIISRERLPAPLQQVVGQGITDPMLAEHIYKLTGRPVVTLQEMKDNEGLLRRALEYYFNLRPGDKRDAKALDKIAKWLFAGAEDPLMVERREVFRDTPRFWAEMPEDVILHRAVDDIQDSPRVTVRTRMTAQRIQQQARDQGWDTKVVDQILEQGPTPRTTGLMDMMGAARRSIRDRVPTIFGESGYGDGEGTYEVMTVHTWWSPEEDARAARTSRPANHDDEPRRVVVKIHRGTQRVLMARELPYSLYEVPLIQIKREHTMRGVWDARGVPEVIDALDREITAQHRSKLNAMAIANAPTFKARIGSGLSTKNMHWVPGQFYWMQRMEDMEPLVVPQHDTSYEREEFILEGKVEQLLSLYDSSLTEQKQLTRPRAATEIQAVTSLQEQAVGADLLLWHRGMARVWRWLHALDVQFGPAEIDVRLTGDDPVQQTRHEIQGEFDFIPAPAALMSPNYRLQQASAVKDVLISAAQAGIQFDPTEYEVRPEEAFMAILEAINPRVAERTLRRREPAEVARLKQQAAQAQAAQQAPVGLAPGLFEGPIDQSAQVAAQAAAAAKGLPNGAVVQVPPVNLGGLV